jgi:hypothetical protein
MAEQTKHHRHPSCQNQSTDRSLAKAPFEKDTVQPGTKCPATAAVKKGGQHKTSDTISYIVHEIVYDIAYDMLCDMPRAKSDMPRAKSMGKVPGKYP